jgi:hypothetical protein
VLYGVVEALSPELAKVGAMAITRARATEKIDAQLDPARVAAPRAQGAVMTPLQAVDYARACIDDGLDAYE